MKEINEALPILGGAFSNINLNGKKISLTFEFDFNDFWHTLVRLCENSQIDIQKKEINAEPYIDLWEFWDKYRLTTPNVTASILRRSKEDAPKMSRKIKNAIEIQPIKFIKFVASSSFFRKVRPRFESYLKEQMN